MVRAEPTPDRLTGHTPSGSLGSVFHGYVGLEPAGGPPEEVRRAARRRTCTIRKS